MAEGKQFFKPLPHARRIIEKNSLIYVPDDNLYLYSENGYWQRLHGDYVERHALEEIDGDSIRSSQLADIRRLVEKLSIMEPGKKFDEFNGHCNIRSGMLDLETFQIKEHNPAHLSRIQLPVSHDPNAKCPTWERFLSEVLGEDSQLIDLFQEFVGYLLVPDTSHHKALVLVGEGANGKSTAIQVIEALLGRQNVCNVSLSDLSNSFHRVRLDGKLVNISTELDPKMLERSDYFKAIVSGDSISAEHKHKPAYDFTPVCKLIFGCNRLPRVRDHSHAFYRRLTIMPFERTFEGETADLYLGKKLIKELDGVFMWALRGLERLRQQGHFTESEQADNALADYRRFNNPLVGFIEDCCRFDPDASTSKTTLYDEYKKYIQENGYSALGKETFFRELYAMRPELESARIRQKGQREQVVMGITVVKYI
jgi:putative DNA primase/helicase